MPISQQDLVSHRAIDRRPWSSHAIYSARTMSFIQELQGVPNSPGFFFDLSSLVPCIVLDCLPSRIALVDLETPPYLSELLFTNRFVVPPQFLNREPDARRLQALPIHPPTTGSLPFPLPTETSPGSPYSRTIFLLRRRIRLMTHMQEMQTHPVSLPGPRPKLALVYQYPTSKRAYPCLRAIKNGKGKAAAPRPIMATPVQMRALANRFTKQSTRERRSKCYCKITPILLTVYQAAEKEDREAVRAFLSVGAIVDAKPSGGVSAMHRAAVRGDLAITDMLLQRGAKVDVTPPEALLHCGMLQRNATRR